MNLDVVLRTVMMIGADLPAYKALFDEVMTLVDETDQARLRSAYDAALLDAARAHQEAQA